MKKVLPIAAYLLPVMALAQTGAAEIIGKISDILNMLIPLIIGLAVVYFIWGILKYVTAGEGDSKAEARSVMIYGIIAIFVMAMSLVLWNAGLLGGLRRYGEVGVRLAMGEPKGHVYRSLIWESILIGLVGSVIGLVLGLSLSFYLQEHGLDVSGYVKNASMLLPAVFRTEITPAAFYIGFIPGLFATVIGTSLAGLGIFKRRTAQLFKELE